MNHVFGLQMNLIDAAPAIWVRHPRDFNIAGAGQKPSPLAMSRCFEPLWGATRIRHARAANLERGEHEHGK